MTCDARVIQPSGVFGPGCRVKPRGAKVLRILAQLGVLTGFILAVGALAGFSRLTISVALAVVGVALQVIASNDGTKVDAHAVLSPPEDPGLAVLDTTPWQPL